MILPMPLWRALLGGLAAAVCLCLSAASADETKKPRSGDLPVFTPGLQVDVEQGVDDLAVDAKGDVWLLTVDPAAFLRVDRGGRIAERIPFSWPDELGRHNGYDRRFAVTTSGDLILGKYRFGRDGRVRSVLPFRQASDLAAGPDDTVVRLSEGGVEVFDRSGRLLRRFSEGGVGPGKVKDPQALAVDLRGRVLVAERTRLQLFDSLGRFVRGTELPEDLTGHPGVRIGSVAFDGRGYVYAGVDNGPVIAVFDPRLRYLGVLPVAEEWGLWPSIAVDLQGRVFSMMGSTLLRSAPVRGSVHGARPLPETPRESGKVRTATAVPLLPRLTDNPRLPFRVHASTHSVHQVAADPRVRGRLWLGTDGGLVRYDPDAESWKRWNLADGLPGTKILSLQSDGRRVYIILENLLAVFDTETETFRRMTVQAEGMDSQHGVRLLRDPAAPDTLWWLLVSGVIRHDLSEDRWTFFKSPDRLIDGLVLSDREEGRRLVVISRSQAWELRPDQRRWRLLTDVDVLDRASRQRYDPSRLVELHSVSPDHEGRTFWLGTSGNGLFRLDAATGKVTWIPETERCWSSRAVRHQGQLLGMGSDCFREPGSCCEIQEGLDMDFRTALPDPVHPEVLWLATSEGLRSYQPAERRLRRHRPGWSEPDGVGVLALQVLDGRLWISPMNRGLSVLDPEKGSWKLFSALRNVQVVRRSAVNGLLLATDLEQSLTWIDPRGLETTSSLVGWKSVWTSLDDVHHDARGLWGIGSPKGKDGAVFGLISPDGTSRTWLQSTGGAYTSHRLLPDPSRPGDFWVVTGEEKLVRFHPETGEAEVIRSRVESIRIEDGRLWIQGFPNAVWDLRTGALTEIGVFGDITPDPGHPDRVWRVSSQAVELCALGPGERVGERIAGITLPDGWSYTHPVVIGDRFFLGTTFGLLEAPFASLFPPDGSPPRRCD
jgi:hypothetical protein